MPYYYNTYNPDEDVPGMSGGRGTEGNPIDLSGYGVTTEAKAEPTPFPWGPVGKGVGIGLGALGVVGGLFGMNNARKGYAKDAIARDTKRYSELTDLNSSYYRRAYDEFRKTYAETAPTVDTLAGFGRTSGLSPFSASTVARRQAMADTARGREGASRSLNQFYIGSQGAADQVSARLGEFETARDSANINFFGELTKGGLGLLSYLV